MPLWMLADRRARLRRATRGRASSRRGAVAARRGLVLSRGSWRTCVHIRFVPRRPLHPARHRAVGVLQLDAGAPAGLDARRAQRPPTGTGPRRCWCRSCSAWPGPALSAGAEQRWRRSRSAGAPAWWRRCPTSRSGRRSLAYRCWGLGVATVGPAIAGFFANLTPGVRRAAVGAVAGRAAARLPRAAFVLIVAGIVVSSPRRKADRKPVLGPGAGSTLRGVAARSRPSRLLARNTGGRVQHRVFRRAAPPPHSQPHDCHDGDIDGQHRRAEAGRCRTRCSSSTGM